MKTEHVRLSQLIRSDDFVGYCPSLDFKSAIVLTNDHWKQQVEGIPEHCLFLATSSQNTDHAVLLRVQQPVQLPNSDELLQVKIENLCRKKSAQDQTGIDPLTRQQLQFHALGAKVLGSFTEEDGVLTLGSDIPDFSSADLLNVHKPRGEALAAVVNFIPASEMEQAQNEAAQLGLTAPFDSYTIGAVKYSSSEKKTKIKVPYHVSPQALLNRRTAILGKTRTGKSTLIKQLVRAIMEAGLKNNHKVGQIIFDVHGEYAHANTQDGGALAKVLPAQTVIYSTNPAPGVLDLRNNFYEQLTCGHALLRNELVDAGKNADYVRSFTSMSLEEPDSLDHGEHERWRIRTAAYSCVLHRAGFKAPAGLKVRFRPNKQVRDLVEAEAGCALPDPCTGITLDEATTWFTSARAAHAKSPLPSSGAGKSWVEDALKNLLDMLTQKSNGSGAYISGFAILKPFTELHSPTRSAEVCQEIYDHLADSKLVIVDVSTTPAEIREKLAAELAAKLFAKSLRIFTSGKRPPSILLYVEEAHRLLDAGNKAVWPVIAREAAKTGMGMVYSSQLVSSIDPQILKSTENFFITHLNCESEVHLLSKFYDLGDFQYQIINCTDVGFVRVRTLFNKFTTPIQVHKFIPAPIDVAA